MFNTSNPFTRAAARLLAVVMVFSLTLLPLTAAAAPDTWYKEQAGTLLDNMQQLAGDANYLSMSASMPEARAIVTQWQEGMAGQEPTVHLFKAPTLEQVMSIAGEGGIFSTMRGMGDIARKRMEEAAVMLLMNYVSSISSSGQASAYMMIASNALTTGAMLEKPEGFEDTVVVYAYDDFVVVVAFRDGGPAVTANTAVTSPAFLEKLQSIQ